MQLPPETGVDAGGEAIVDRHANAASHGERALGRRVRRPEGKRFARPKHAAAADHKRRDPGSAVTRGQEVEGQVAGNDLMTMYSPAMNVTSGPMLIRGDTYHLAAAPIGVSLTTPSSANPIHPAANSSAGAGRF